MLSAGVNFFGHAAVASWHADDGGWLLGAMLPDFASMIGARLDAQPDPRLAAGVAHHHATDAAFHHAPAVVGLMRDAEARLTARGVRRGPTRAVAHVGVELLLDGVLTRDGGYRASFAAGLAHPGPVAWTHGDGDLRFAQLLERLRAAPPPTDLDRGAGVARRLDRILGHRPRLAPTPAERPAIVDVLDALAARVAVATPTVLTQVRAALPAL